MLEDVQNQDGVLMSNVATEKESNFEIWQYFCNQTFAFRSANSNFVNLTTNGGSKSDFSA
jgi:hypothetical protein